MNVTICLPRRGAPIEEHERCLFGLFKRHPDWRPLMLPGPNIDIVRACLVETALSEGASVVLFLDGDNTFTVEACEAVVEEAAARLAVVGALYAQKPSGRPALRWHGESLVCYEGGGLYEVMGVGLGVTAIAREVFEGIRLEKKAMNGLLVRPWFTSDISWDELLPDDDSFCRRAREAGFRVFVDTRHRVGHVGPHEFFLEDAARAVRPKSLVLTGAEDKKPSG